MSENSLCYSPFSLMHSLLLLASCSNDSAIQEMTERMHLDKAGMMQLIKRMNSDPSIKLASNIFQKQLQAMNPAFVKLVTEQFGVVPEKLQSAEQVNNWCTQHTNGKINHIIDDVNFETLLISAIHFKDTWKLKFDKSRTTKEDFHGFETKSTVDMMKLEKKLRYTETHSAQVLELEYEHSVMKALLILPKNQSQEMFLDSLNPENIIVKTEEVKVNLKLPKFKVESSFELKQALQSQGVNSIFKSIDCSKTLGSQMIVDEIIQKTFIQVDEEGTEAAAVTAIRMKSSCIMKEDRSINFFCDKPFWFILKNKSNEPVFVCSFVQ